MARQRHRKSSIDRLPPAVREEIGRLRVDKGYTIDQILEHLRQMDVRVGRSALGLHTQRLDVISEQIKRSRRVGEAVIERLGEAPESRQARVNIELMQSLIMDLLAGEGDQPVQLTPQSAMLLSDALSKLARAHKSDVDRELQLRKEVVAKVGKSIDAGERELSRGEQDPAAVLRRIREEVYGILS